jgi:TolB-like protein
VEIQEEIRARNSELPEPRRMEFRSGLNLGDVIEDEGRIYGDGVNIAARVEGLAEGGGICLAENAYQQVKNKLSLGIEYLGEHEVKNISEPVPVYRLVMEPGAARRKIKRRKPAQTGWKRAALASIGLLVLLVAAGAIRKRVLRLSPPPFEPASAERLAFPLPEKPSIAVLPFLNMSGDPEQEYLSDGITEDLITDLSKISELFVIARNSVFTYKGRSVKIAQVSEELGVQYVLEGSVRKADDRVRITAQLVDASTGYHIWSERYDRNMKDVFDLQDEVTQKIVAALAIELTEDEQDRLTQRRTENLEAFDYFMRGSEYLNRFTEHENRQATQMFEKAIALDPRYAAAYTRLAMTHLHEWNFGWSRDPQSLQRAFELVQKATALDDSVPEAHRTLGRVYLWKKQHETAIAEHEKAIALDPNDAHGYAGLGDLLIWAGRSEEGLVLVEKAMRLNPMYPVWYLLNLGRAYYKDDVEDPGR